MTSLPTMDGALLNQRKIESCTITFLSPDDVRAQSVTALHESSFLWNGEHPLPYGVLDPRMGSTDPRIRCATCKSDKCEHGHYGHIELALPIYNPLAKEEFVHAALACVCYFCAALLPLSREKHNAAMQLRHTERLKFFYRIHKEGNQDPNPKKTRTTIKCSQCSQPQPLYKNVGSVITAEWRRDDLVEMVPYYKEQTKRAFNVYSALQILRGVSKEDLTTLGFENSRPEYGIISALAVPPVWMRPPRGRDGSKSKGQNDMSTMFSQIIKTQNKMRVELKKLGVQENNEENPFGGDGSIPDSIKNLHSDTFFYCSALTGKIDSKAKIEMNMRASSDRSSAAYRAQNQPVAKSAATSIGGKDGCFRGDNMGKRTSHNGRAVITPCAALDVDEVGVPAVMYMNLTYPERVIHSESVLEDGTREVLSNVEDLQRRVLLGPDDKDGARFVISPNKEMYSLSVSLEKRRGFAKQLRPGWIVERLLKDGDWVILNRQPTLHKHSMVAMRVRRLPPGDNTIRFSLPNTKPFNADFDGDEMNIHVPQDEMSRAELMELMALQYNLLSDATGFPSLCMIQDGLVAMRHLSLPNTFLKRAEVFQLAMQIHYLHKHPSQRDCLIGEDGADALDYHMNPVEFDARRLPIPCILKPEQLWSGKQIISLLLPHINIDEGGNSGADEKANFDRSNQRLLIRDGELLRGVLTKGDLGGANHSILQIIAKDLPNGGKHAINFLSDAQRVAEHFWAKQGFSVGLDDITLSPHTQGLLDQMIQATYDKVNDIYQVIDALELGCSQEYFNAYKDQAAEKAVTMVLQRALVHAGDIINAELEKTNNSLHIMACRAKSKGSVSNLAQIMGLVGQQLVCGQRISPKGEGKTLPSQIPNSRHPKHRGMIVNGFHQRPTPGEFFQHAMSSREGLTDTSCKTSATGYLERRLMKALESIVVHTDGTVRSHGGQTDDMSMIIESRWGGDGLRCAYLEEVDMERLLYAPNDHIAEMYCAVATQSSEMDLVASETQTLLHLRDVVREIRLRNVHATLGTVFTVPMDMNRLVLNVCGGKPGYDGSHAPCIAYADLLQLQDRFRVDAQRLLGGDVAAAAAACISAHVLSCMCSKNVLRRWRLDQQTVMRVFAKYLTCIERSLVSYGEAVGSLTAHGIGEPTTQLTLNTFHHIAHNYGTIGIESMKEIVSLTDKLECPTMTIPVHGGERVAHMLAQTLVNTLLKDVADSSSVERLGDEPVEAVLETDRYLNTVALSVVPPNCYFIRFLLEARVLTARGLSPEFVREAVCAALNTVNPQSCIVLSSDTNMNEWVLHVYVRNIDAVMKQALKKNYEAIDAAELALIQEDVLRSMELTLLQKVHLCGIEGVDDVMVHTQKTEKAHSETGVILEKEMYVIETDGCSLQRALSLPFVDWARITCNSMKAIHETLGIQAMSVALFNELKRQLGSNGKKVDDRYIALLADFITCQGYPVSITRFDLNEIPTTGDLDKATFEQPMLVLTNAAGIGKHAPLSGVSSSILVGKQFNLGTGMVKLIDNSAAAAAAAAAAADSEVAPMDCRDDDTHAVKGPRANRAPLLHVYPPAIMSRMLWSVQSHIYLVQRLPWKDTAGASVSVLADAMDSSGMYSPTQVTFGGGHDYAPSSPPYCPSSPPYCP